MYKIEENRNEGDGLIVNIIGIFDDLTIAKQEIESYVLEIIKNHKKMYKNITYTATWTDNTTYRVNVKNFPELSAVYTIESFNTNQLYGI